MLTHLVFFAESLMTIRAKSPDFPIRDLTLPPASAAFSDSDFQAMWDMTYLFGAVNGGLAS